MSKDNYNFQRLSEKNVFLLLGLYSASFGKDRDLFYHLNKYDTSFAGKRYLGYLALDKSTNEVAAFYGVFPVNIKYNGRIVCGAQSGDTMTSPAHQGKGLFTTLAKLTYELCKQEGIDVVFGLPNSNSFHGFAKKLGWSFIGSVKKCYVRTGALPYYKISNRLGISLLNGFYIKKRIQSHSTSVDNCMNNHGLEMNTVEVCRSVDYFLYKYRLGDFHISSFGQTNFVWKEKNGEIVIGHIFGSDTSNKDIYNLQKFFKRVGISEFVIYVVENSSLESIINKFGTAGSNVSNLGYLCFNESLKMDEMRFMFIDADYF